MNWKIIQWRSLNTRVTIFTLIIFVVSIWSLAFYATRMLRTDMERQLGEQPFSTVSIVAADIDQELGDRLRALEAVAGRITPAMLGNAPTLQALFEERPHLKSLFNAGLIAYRLDGTAIADSTPAAGRGGVNYLDVVTIAAALKDGKSTIGQPVMGAYQTTGGQVLGIVRNITERKHTEEENLRQLDELRRWQQATLGREGRVLAMKKEVNHLLAAQGQPPRYPSAADGESET